ncbi:MAG: hypothetical protein KAT75_04265 [Dehalococcoidia bacterium]|nr:hypothetical protein [Dehalococcoidia bacterium]
MTCQDLPDYTRKVIIEYTGGFIGLEELATRLGFIAPFNLQGNLVLMEDFETEETEWTSATGVPLDTVLRTSRTKWSGNWCIHCHTEAGAGAEAWAIRALHFAGIARYGLFGRAKWDADLGILGFEILLQSRTHTYYVGVRYNLTTTTLEVRDIGVADHVVDNALTINPATAIWFPILLTFDLNTLLFDRLYFAEIEYDISAHAFTATALAASPFTQITFGTEGFLGSAAHDTHWDDIVLVKNLPA